MVMTQDEFAELVAPITDRIRGRALDKALEEDLNRTFPADGALFQSVFGACRRVDVQPRGRRH